MFRKDILKIILAAGFLLTVLQGRINAEMKDAPKTVKRLHTTLSELKQSVGQALQERETLRTQVQALKRQIKELQNDLKVSQDSNDKLDAALKELSSEESQQQKVEQLKPAENQFSKEMENIEEQLKVLDEESRKIPEENAARRKEAMERFDALKIEVDHLKAQRDEFASLIGSVQNMFDKRGGITQVPLDEKRLQDHIAALAGENDALKLELERLKKTRMTLQEDQQVKAR